MARCRTLLGLILTALALAVLAAAFAGHREEIGRALAELPSSAILLATALHVTTLLLRAEAWRLTLAATNGRVLRRRTVHAASAGAFLVGTAETTLALPARLALLRRLDGSSPALPVMALADAPIFMLEVVFSALALCVGAVGVAFVPPWAAALGAGLAIALLFLLRLGHRRFAHRRVAAGLAVLADRRARLVLTGIVATLTALTVARVWLLLGAAGLPNGPAEVALLFVAYGVLGLLPIGPASGAGAALAVVGAGQMAAAAAAGIAISATSILAVGVYALLVLAALAMRARARVPARARLLRPAPRPG
jgi:uncharacterized membrane protein YbhN (UPF0104 family)